MGALVRVFGVPASWRGAAPSAAVTAVVGLGLGLAFAVGAPAAAEATAQVSTAPAKESADKPLTAPDGVTAGTIAALTGEPVEVLGERTESGSVFVLPDGTRAAGQGSGPVWVRRGGDGTQVADWAPVDLTLTVGEDGLVRPVAQGAGLVLSGGVGDPGGAAAGVEHMSNLVPTTSQPTASPEVTPDPLPSASAPAGAGSGSPSPTPSPSGPSPDPEVTGPAPTPSAPAVPAPAVEAPPAEAPPMVEVARVIDPVTGVTTRVEWAGVLPVPELTGVRATYRSVEPGVDLVVEATATGFEQFFVVNERPEPGAQVRFPLTIATDGAPVSVADDGSLSVQTAAGQAVASAPVPFMWDADSDAGRAFPITEPRPEDAGAVQLSPMPDYVADGEPGADDERADASTDEASGADVVDEGRVDPLADAVAVGHSMEQVAPDAVEYTLEPDAAFLQDPETVFPVVVDPEVSLGYGFDTTVVKGYSNDRSLDGELQVGTYNGGANVARSFIHFPTSSFAGMAVHDATISLFNFYSYSCTPRGWGLHATGPAGPGSTWANQPEWGHLYAASSQTSGYSGCGGDWAELDVTQLAKDWAAQGAVEGYVGIRADDERDNLGWKRFSSGDQGELVPTLWVRYNAAPSTPGYLQVTPSPNATSNYAWTSSLTPKMSAFISDPDGGVLGARFRVQRADTGAVVFEQVVGAVANGSYASVQVPASANLAPGGLYALSVWGRDPFIEGPGAGPWYFSVDTSAPRAPLVSSTAFQPTGWLNKNPGEQGDVLLSMPPSDGSVTGYYWGLDKAPSTFVVGMGGVPATVKIAPATAGKHELQVQAVDRAGNRSPVTRYAFTVGQAGLTSPTDGAQVVRRARLTIESKPGFDTVSFEWRRGPDSPTSRTVDATFLSTSDGQAWAATSASLPGERSYTTWDVGRLLGFEPGPVQVRAKLTGPNGVAAQTQWVTVTVDPDADGAAGADVGAGSVNLLTGDHGLSATDVSEFGVSVVRSTSSRDTDSGYQLQGDLLSAAEQQATSVTTLKGGNAVTSVATDRYHTGTTSLKIVPSAGSTNGDTFAAVNGDSDAPAIGWRAGSTYRFSGWVYVPGTDGGAVPSGASARALKMTLFTQVGGVYAEPTTNGAATADPRVVNAWQKVTFDATIPVNATKAFLRVYNGFTGASGQAVYWDDLSVREVWSPFGREWALGTADQATGTAYTHISHPYPETAAVHLTGGGQVWFSTTSGEKWWPQPGAEDLTLTATSPTTWRLTELDGTITDFTQKGTDFPVSASFPPGATGVSTPTTRYGYAPVGGVSRLNRIIAPVQDGVDGGPGNPQACTTTPVARGCQVMDLVYATSTGSGTTSETFGPYAGRVSSITATAWDPTTLTMKTTPVAQYSYDSAGRLREVYDPRLVAAGSPALVTRYSYSATGQVTTWTPPGQEPVTFTHGAAGAARTTGAGDLIDANPGRLLTVSRATLNPAAPINTTRVVYDVPLTPGAGGPYDLSTTALQSWAQVDGPTDATALFGPDHTGTVPSTATKDSPGAGGYDRAEVHYLNASGREVNTASSKGSTTPVEGFIDTQEYDQYGNVIRILDATNRLLALHELEGGDGALADWGIEPGTPSSTLATMLDSRTVYTGDGLDVVAQIGPVQKLAVANDANDTRLLRPVTLNTYDENKPAGGAVYHLRTTTVTGAAPLGATNRADGAYDVAQLLDPLTTTYGYTPQGGPELDGASGWVHKQPTRVVVDPGGANAVTTTTYDERGRVTRTVPPGASDTHPATTLIDYYTSGAESARSECRDHPEWAGKACTTRSAGAITGHDAARMGAELPVRTVSGYTLFGAPTAVTETVAGVTRTTTTAYDAANRTTSVQVSGGLGAAVPASTTSYDPATGQVATSTSTAGTITRAYDTLGRLTKYTDASGAWTATAYDRFGKPVKVTTSIGASTEYVYDRAVEPRGLVTSIVDSVAGTINPVWGPDGQLESQALPGGVTMRVAYDAARVPVARSYTVPGQAQALLTDTVVENNRGQWVRHATSALGGQLGTQDYAYDTLGRLASVKDANPAAGRCTWRAYAFDARGSRTDKRTTVEASTEVTTTGCVRNPSTATLTAADTAVRTVNDTGDRLVSSDALGGQSWVYDAFGRVTTMPDADGTGTVTNTYFANDLIAAQAQADTATVAWTLDPLQRRTAYTRQNWDTATAAWGEAVTTTSYYGDDSDNPAWIKEGTAADAPLTRYVAGADGQASVSTTRTGGRTLLLSDLHGDVVTTVPLTDGAGVNAGSIRHHTYDEFGNTRTLGSAPASPGRYGWLGAHERSSDTLGGVTLMGVRLYSAAIGRFLSVDPVPGGNTTAYNYPQDPINQFDLDGKYAIPVAEAALMLALALIVTYIAWCMQQSCMAVPIMAPVHTRVPFPSPRSKSATKRANDTYLVYAIVADNGSTYKYGISRQKGLTRPNSQLSGCRKYYNSGCRSVPLTRVRGFYQARTVEATLILGYTMKNKGKCPPGQAKSCR